MISKPSHFNNEFLKIPWERETIKGNYKQSTLMAREILSANKWRESIQVWTLGGQSSVINYFYDWRAGRQYSLQVTSLTNVMVRSYSWMLTNTEYLAVTGVAVVSIVCCYYKPKGSGNILVVAAGLFLFSRESRWSDDGERETRWCLSLKIFYWCLSVQAVAVVSSVQCGAMPWCLIVLPGLLPVNTETS